MVNSRATLPKQKTHLLRAQCDACGLIFRITAKWCAPILLCPDATCAGRVCVAA